VLVVGSVVVFRSFFIDNNTINNTNIRFSYSLFVHLPWVYGKYKKSWVLRCFRFALELRFAECIGHTINHICVVWLWIGVHLEEHWFNKRRSGTKAKHKNQPSPCNPTQPNPRTTHGQMVTGFMAARCCIFLRIPNTEFVKMSLNYDVITKKQSIQTKLVEVRTPQSPETRNHHWPLPTVYQRRRFPAWRRAAVGLRPAWPIWITRRLCACQV